MEKQVYPIIFAPNDKYALYCYASIRSLIYCTDPKKEYDVRVIHTGLSEKYIRLMESLTNDHVRVSCMNITDEVKGADLRSISFFTVETFYRLFIAKVLKEYKKVLYLDSDMIVRKDVAKIFDTDMGDCVIAAARDVPCSMLKMHCEDIGVDYRETCNAGVMLIDVEKFEDLKVREQCLEHLAEDYKRKERKLIFLDQDVMNIVLRGKIHFLDDRWNFQWQYLWRPETVFKEFRDRYSAAEKDAWIFHYAGDKKAWSYPDFQYADYFWDTVRDTPVYKDLVRKVIVENRSIAKAYGFRFPFEDIAIGSRVALYAAGEVGRSFYEVLCGERYAKLALWVDRDYQKLNEEHKVHKVYDSDSYELTAPENLVGGKYEYDKVIVCLDDAAVAEKVIIYIEELGVPTEKIVFENYHKNYLDNE